MTAIQVNVAAPDDWERIRRVDELAFGFTSSEERAAQAPAVLEMDRTLVATLDGADAGLASTFSLQMSVPGVSRLPVAGLTWVGVLPTHRRRGVLTALMRRHLDDLHEQGRESVAALWAAEPGIYGRYGYGLSSQRLSIKVPREFARLGSPPEDEPQAAFADPESVRPQLALVADAVAASRPGFLHRTPVWWDRTLSDLPGERDGASALRTLLVTDDGGPRGYALYRTKESWGPGGAEGTLDIREVAATDPAAHRALWRVLLGTDLVGEVSYYNLPVDDPLTRLLVDPRRAAPRLVDALFTRLVDVARALTARTYAVPVEVVLDLDDPFCPWNSGCWRLSGGPDGATCAPTTEDADLSLDAQALGALFLGGTSLRALADAGMVREHRSGAIDDTGRAFRAAREPWCPFVF